MSTFRVDRAVAGDVPAVAELVRLAEELHHGSSVFSTEDLEAEWAESDVTRDVHVVREGERVVGYRVVRERREPRLVEAYVHPDALGRGIGTLLASGLEEDAARDRVHELRNVVLEADVAACALLRSLGYTAIRVFREMRITLDAAPPAPKWPDGVRVVPFDPQRDARAFHAAHQEAFADHWGHAEKPFEAWSQQHLESDRFDPSLWCVVKAGDDIAAGTICTGDTYGGGFVHALFTRRSWRGRGTGTSLLRDVFGRFRDRGEREIGLGVDAANETGAFRLYERAGMTPALGWIMFEKRLSG